MAQQRRQTLEDSATHVLASQDVPSRFVEAQLQMAQSIAGVSRLEVEGFVLSDAHHSIYRMLQFMLFSSSKNWKSVQFIDTISHDDLTQWQAAKGNLMREAERNQDFEKDQWCNGKIAWNVTLNIPATVDLHGTMEQIRNDNDIFEVTMKQIREIIVLQISCGWASRTTSAELLLRSHLSKSSRRVGQKQLMSDRSDTSMSASSLSTFDSSGGSRSIRRQRKRARRMSKKETGGSPDYDWKDGVYRNAPDYDWKLGNYNAKASKQ